jgi:hypothetical protein
MANRNRTTSTPRRATAAKAAPNPKEIICRLKDEASAEAYGLGHLGELMELFGDCVSTPYAGWTNMQMQQIGLRIEYMAGLVKGHAEAIGKTLEEIRDTAGRMQEGGAS